jgi:hypothetical protein
MEGDQRTKPNLEEREKLPEELQEPYDALVEAYRYYAIVHYRHPFVSYKVLAELVRDGWRLSSNPVNRSNP